MTFPENRETVQGAELNKDRQRLSLRHEAHLPMNFSSWPLYVSSKEVRRELSHSKFFYRTPKHMSLTDLLRLLFQG